jgi:hypothetical protein
MDIVEKYLSLSDKHNSFFSTYSSNDRIKFAEEIISLKRDIDKIESEIISKILSFSIDYQKTHTRLKENHKEKFLDTNDSIQNFLTNSSVTSTVGYNKTSRESILEEYFNLCKTYWEDYLITSDERNYLNKFCKDNLIDVLTQQSIETKVILTVNADNFNIQEIVKYYTLKEGKSSDEIERILKREYKLRIKQERIESILNEIEDLVNNSERTDDSIALKVQFGKTEIIVELREHIRSEFQFEIQYISGYSGDFKVIIERNLFNNLGKMEFIDLLSDAISYKSEYESVPSFLELKPKIKNRLKEMLSNYSMENSSA